MSRIIVKNLPKTITEKKIREMFEAKGFITDLQLKYNKAGKFRQFAFVGYKTEDEAKAAMDYFNNTFVYTSKIKIEMCTNLNDPNRKKTWKEFLKEKAEEAKLNEIKIKSPTENKKEQKKNKTSKSNQDDIPIELKKDPKFQEFLAIHEDRKSKPLWADDSGAVEESDNSELSSNYDDDGYDTAQKDESKHDENLMPQQKGKNKNKKSKNIDKQDKDKSTNSTDQETSNKKIKKSENSDKQDKDKSTNSTDQETSNKKNKRSKNRDKQDKDKGTNSTDQETSNKKKKMYDDKYTVKLRNLPWSCKKKQIKEFFHPLKIASLRMPRKNKRFSYASFKTEKDMNKALNKHRGFLGGQMIDVIKYSRKDNFEDEKRNQQVKSDDKADMELLAETGRIYVRNLCFSVTESDLQQLFSHYGPLSELFLPIDRITKKAQGFAFVSYLFAEHAVKAFTELDGSIFQGRLLHLIPAQPKKEIKVDEDETNYKKKKEAKIKALSGSSHNWNILFLGMNAVADVIAEKYNVEKSQLLTPTGGESVAVRMALAETNLVSETRKFLIENGVQLDAFSQAAGERSKTVIIVKHLPAKTSAEELNELFSNYGTIQRIILPPSGLVALIEFQESAEAKEAFKKLAYRRFHYLPLYLEWAPLDSLKDPPPKTEESEPVKQKADESTQDESIQDESLVDIDENKPLQGTTVFVKNLNFDTTEESFKKHFKYCGHILSAHIATKKDLKTGKLLSMGFGFVQFKTKQSAVEAVKNLQLSKLDGHSLEVKLSTRATVPYATTQKRKYEIKNQPSAKILVRNVAFQASEKDVRALFCEFGLLKSVRMPKKMGNDDGHKGFAFVEYLTKTDAKRAFEALCHSTHLFGRRLVLEWTNSDSEDISAIRKKTAKDFAESGQPNKKFKMSKLKDDVALASNRLVDEEDESDI